MLTVYKELTISWDFLLVLFPTLSDTRNMKMRPANFDVTICAPSVLVQKLGEKNAGKFNYMTRSNKILIHLNLQEITVK